MKKILLVLLLVSIVFVSGCSSGIPASGKAVAKGDANTGLKVGDKAPDFAVTTTDGITIKLSDLSNQKKPAVVYFFATWCPFCHEELASLKTVYPEYSDKVEFVAIDLDIAENQERVARYKLKNAYVGGFTQGDRKVLSDYNAIRTTTKYAIDKDGIIQYTSSGELTKQEWKTLFTGLIAY